MDTPEKIVEEMGFFSLRDTIHVRKLLQQDLSPRVFAIRFVQFKLNPPDGGELSSITQWPDELLIEVVRKWTEQHLENVAWNPPEDISPLAYFRQLLQGKIEANSAGLESAGRRIVIQVTKDASPAYESLASSIMQSASETSRALQEALKVDLDRYSFPSQSLAKTISEQATAIDVVRSSLAEAATRITSPLVEIAGVSSRSLVGMLDDSLGPLRRAATLTAIEHSSAWHENLLTAGALQERLASMSEISIAAQSVLAGIDVSQIGAAFSVSKRVEESLADTYLGLAHSYSTFVESFTQRPQVLLTLPEVVSFAPPRAFLSGAHVLEAISAGVEGDEYEEVWQPEPRLLETEDTLDALLLEFDPSLLQLLNGARQALVSSNPDRIRHFITSFRELFTQILHQLSPDNAVKAWSVSDGDFDRNGRPTRRARLVYVCREINHEPFCQFIDKDIDAILEVVELFQRGTHSVTRPFTDRQAAALQIKAEGVLRYLLEIADTSHQ